MGNDIYVYSINAPYMVFKNKANQNVKDFYDER